VFPRDLERDGGGLREWWEFLGLGPWRVLGGFVGGLGRAILVCYFPCFYFTIPSFLCGEVCLI
jgi:hypothetical protein